jgi:hypothetical protein
MALRCYNCGFEASDKDKAVFLRNQGDDRHTWVQFCCPQCVNVNPPVVEVPLCFGERAPFEEPRWEVKESPYGIYVAVTFKKGGGFSSPMVPQHQLWNAPASILRPGLEGTVANYSSRLRSEGEARSAAFKADCDAWRAANPAPMMFQPTYQAWVERHTATMEAFRKQHKVGDYFGGEAYDGPTLMQRAGLTRRLVRVA